MWTPKFAFDPDGRHEDGDDDAVPAPITAHVMLRGALIVGAFATLLFVLVPGIDLAAARLFYLGDRQFLGSEVILVPIVRSAFIVFFYATCIVTLVGLIMAIRNSGPWLDLPASQWLFVTVCLITGPLVVANIGLKDHWGRARPRDVIEFAGTKEFTAAVLPAGQCSYNCSFVSGEASSIFIVLFAAALLFKPRSRKFVTMAIVFGGLAGLIRMAQGGHFLSDVVFAGVLMAITAASIRIFFDTLEAERLRPAESGSA